MDGNGVAQIHLQQFVTNMSDQQTKRRFNSDFVSHINLYEVTQHFLHDPSISTTDLCSYRSRSTEYVTFVRFLFCVSVTGWVGLSYDTSQM